jgi:hypothetical protein
MCGRMLESGGGKVYELNVTARLIGVHILELHVNGEEVALLVNCTVTIRQPPRKELLHLSISYCGSRSDFFTRLARPRG